MFVDSGSGVKAKRKRINLRHELNPYVIFYRKFSYGVRIARVLYKNRAMEKYL